ncbi:MAG: diheme cytochrome c-553 [Betaproteobacteria bacterium]
MRNVVWMAGCLLCLAMAGTPAAAQDKSRATIKRGEYLTVLGGCNDCHSPKLMTPEGPEPDPARLLSGHPAGTALAPVPPGTLSPDKWIAMTNGDFTAWVGPWGTSFAANLTPDVATGIGGWTAEQFIKTVRTGKHLGVGRPILPPMPTPSLAALTDADLKAIHAYLRSLKPISNQVPAPLPPSR